MSWVRHGFVVCSALVGCWQLLGGRPAHSEEPANAGEFRTAKSSIVQQLRDRDKETRIAAAAKLANYSSADSIKLLLTQVVASKDEDLRRTGFEALLKLNGSEEAC